jgi:hypothetical protein
MIYSIKTSYVDKDYTKSPHILTRFYNRIIGLLVDNVYCFIAGCIMDTA